MSTFQKIFHFFFLCVQYLYILLLGTTGHTVATLHLSQLNVCLIQLNSAAKDQSYCEFQCIRRHVKRSCSVRVPVGDYDRPLAPSHIVWYLSFSTKWLGTRIEEEPIICKSLCLEGTILSKEKKTFNCSVLPILSVSLILY